MNVIIIAQVFGFVAFILYTLSLQFKKKRNILNTQIIANTFYALEYLMLNAYAGLNNSLFGIMRSLLFSVADKKRLKLPLYVPILFTIIVLIFGYVSYTDLFSIIPVFISIAFFIALYTNNLKIYRLIAALASGLWIVYNYHVLAYIGVFDSVIELTSSLIAIYRFDIKRDRKKITITTKQKKKKGKK